MKLAVDVESWELKSPTVISGYRFTEIETVLVTLTDDGAVGRGEAYGVYYRGETPQSIVRAIEENRSAIEAGIDRGQLRSSMKPGGARNAVDCALWALESHKRGIPVWKLAGLKQAQPILTTRTIWGQSPQKVFDEASTFSGAPIVKLKLLGDGEDSARVEAARKALPKARLCVDVNQGFDRRTLEASMPAFVEARLEMIEQPFPVGKEAWLDGLERPIPIAADESVQSVEDIATLEGRFDMVNIKLDKSGGLSEALEMVKEARRHGFEVMVGCMTSTSLSMAPAFIVGQLADLADLDGPLYLTRDREPSVQYFESHITVPPGVWGADSHCPLKEAPNG